MPPFDHHIPLRKAAGFCLVFLAIVFGWLAGTARAQLPFGTQVGAFPFQAAHVLADPTRDRVYATVPATNSVAVIDTASLRLLRMIPVDDNPSEMAISPDGTHLFVSTGEYGQAGQVTVINLDSSLVFPVRFSLPYRPGALACGLDLRLYAVAAAPYNGFYQIDANTGAIQNTSVTKYVDGGSLQISPDYRTLYVLDELLYSYDVSTVVPTLRQRSTRGFDVSDLQVSHDGLSLVIPGYVGSSNSKMDILFSTGNIDSALGAYSGGPGHGVLSPLVYSPDDALIYGYEDYGERLIAFSTRTFTSATEVELPSLPTSINDATSLALDRTSSYLFLSRNDFSPQATPPSLLVFATGGGNPPPPVLSLQNTYGSIVGPGRFRVVVNRYGDLTHDITVRYEVSSSRRHLVYPLKGYRVIKAGHSKAGFDVVSTNKAAGEVTVTLQADPAYGLGPRTETQVLISYVPAPNP